MSIRGTPSDQAEALVPKAAVDGLGTQETMKWALNTFDCLVEAFRSAPNKKSKEVMLQIIRHFGPGLKMPNREEATEPVPDEYKTLMDDWKQAQAKFEQLATLSRMADILSTTKCLLYLVRAPSRTEEGKRGMMCAIEKGLSEWLQMPDLEKTREPGVADEYKTLMDEWEQVEQIFQEWRLHEMQTVGSA
jgi:hypothetical protein